MDKKKKRLYISAAALLLLTVVLIIALIYSVRHSAGPEETPEPEPSATAAVTHSPAPRPTASPQPSPTPSPVPTPNPDIPAITPPAITAVNPASGSDIVLVTAEPSTNSDISVPGSGSAGGNNGQ